EVDDIGVPVVQWSCRTSVRRTSEVYSTMNRPARGNGNGGNRTQSVSFDRVPPQSLENEQGVLGSMMIARSAIEKAREILRPGDFYRDAHRHIFDAICNLNDRSEPADLLTLTEELRRLSHIDQVGGAEYLTTLI